MTTCALGTLALLATTAVCHAEAQQATRIYHWPNLKFVHYTSARLREMPNGDIDPQRAFYWGRVLGTDGLSFSIRGLTDALEEGNWFEPVYRNESERARLFGLCQDFQQLYAKYGCGDNFLHVTAHPMLKKHPTHVTDNPDQWRIWVLDGMRQRAELMKFAGIHRLLIDLEYLEYKHEPVSSDPRFWYDLGRDIMRAMLEAHPEIRVGFYPDLDDLIDIPRDQWPVDRLADRRHGLLKGLYDHRGTQPLWNFIGGSYARVDQSNRKKGSTDYQDLVKWAITHNAAHHTVLGPEIEFMFGRWDLGISLEDGPFDPIRYRWFWGIVNQPNLSVDMMRHDYHIIAETGEMIGTWDHGTAWDEDGAIYKRLASEEEFQQWNDKLAELEIQSRFHHNRLTDDTWHFRVPADAPLSERVKLFHIAKTPDGSYHISGQLPDNFAHYVSVTKEVSGKHDLTIPIHTEAEYQWAVEYKRRGFFEYQQLQRSEEGAVPYGYLVPIE